MCSGGLSPEEVADTAAAAERSGYSSLWITVLGGITDPGRLLDAALATSSELTVGLGVVPLDAFPASRLAVIVGDLPERVIVGVGTGRRSGDVAAFVHAELATLRAAAPSVRLAVGSYGRKVLNATGQTVDALVLNWTTPARIRWAREISQAGASAAGAFANPPEAFVYVPVARGPEAARTLDDAWRSGSTHRSQREHRAAMNGEPPLMVALSSSGFAALPGLDEGTELVVNPLGTQTARDRRNILDICAPHVGRPVPESL